jgi:hypothetical protein
MKRHPRVSLSFRKKIVRKQPGLPLELSAIERVGDDLWLGADEGTTLERLSPIGPADFGEHVSFSLDDFLVLPAGVEQEIDIEGLAYDPPFLWLTGSHSLARKKPKGKDLAKDIERLAEMTRGTNRFLLARIPVRIDPQTKRSELATEDVDPADSSRTITASQVFGTSRTNLLTDLMEEDEHCGRFLHIPSKENGFDIEGLAVVGTSVFLGLRGPVLRGWAVILEVRVTELSREYLTLAPLNGKGDLYRKHFLDLDGLGVRDLCRVGDDLLVLAGPTLDMSGPMRLVRWPDVRDIKRSQIAEKDDLEVVAELSLQRHAGVDQAEGVCVYDDGHLLLIYDSPAPNRVTAAHRVEADLIPRPRVPSKPAKSKSKRGEAKRRGGARS